MGTTLDALQAGSGQFGFSLLIEGYPYILCDAGDVSAVETAYAATDWEAALPGLKVVGGIKQSIEPFKEDLDVPTLTFHVMDCDGNDTFGKAVWKSKPTIQSRLNAVFQPDATGAGSITVRDNATGPAAFPASGTVYIGKQAISYSALSGTTLLTVPAAGANIFSPFAAAGSNQFAIPGNVAGGHNWDVAAPPRVSDVPATWIGKHVALYIHRIKGGVWDTRAQAHIEFAGTIDGIEDGEGVTVITCDDIRKKIENATLLRKQFVGYAKPGINLKAGDTLEVVYNTNDSSGEFTVVSGAAADETEITAGLYELSDFIARLNNWIWNATIEGGYTFSIESRDGGYRTVLKASFSSDRTARVELRANGVRHAGYDILEFLGYEPLPLSQAGHYTYNAGVSTSEITIVSESAPWKTRAISHDRGGSRVVEFESTSGQFYNSNGFYPAYLNEESEGEDNWSYFKVGDQLLMAEWDGTSKLTNVAVMSSATSAFKGSARKRAIKAAGITYDDPGGTLPIYQVVVLAGKFSTVIPSLFASLGGAAGVNHEDYDVLPGGAGIPWSLLGDDFVASCEALESAGETDSICVLLEKPTKLKDILIPEMALRFAFLVFKNGGLLFVSPPMPNALTCDHTLDETNKAVGVGEQVPMTSSSWTSDYMVNVVKVSYEREGGEQPLEIIDGVSASMHGLTEPVEIDAVNSTSYDGGVSGSSVEHLAAEVSTKIFPMFGKPVKLVTRTIAPTHYTIAPGDTVSLSDDLVRDPTSGVRGLSNRATVCLSSYHDYGHENGQMTGEVTLIMSDEDRTYPLGAAAEIDTAYSSGLYTNGYDSTNFRVRLKDHSFSKSTDGLDSGNFSNSDAVRIVELDPANPSSIDAWSRTVASSAGVGLQYLQFTAGISSPAWSGATKKFVVIPQAYTSCTASQKLHAFQADDADGHVQDVAEPNSYGSETKLAFSRGVATDLPALLADELVGDGKPLTPFQLQYMTRMINNMASYKTAPHQPMLFYDSPGTSASDYAISLMFPFFIGGYQQTGRARYLSIAARMRSGTAGQTAYCRVTSSRFPPSGNFLTNIIFTDTFRSVIFSTTSATHATQTAQNLLPVPAQIRGYTWITVELRATTGHTAHLRGFPTFYLKPVSAP